MEGLMRCVRQQSKQQQNDKTKQKTVIPVLPQTHLLQHSNDGQGKRRQQLATTNNSSKITTTTTMISVCARTVNVPVVAFE
jgi:hypothetical protein